MSAVPVPRVHGCGPGREPGIPRGRRAGGYPAPARPTSTAARRSRKERRRERGARTGRLSRSSAARETEGEATRLRCPPCPETRLNFMEKRIPALRTRTVPAGRRTRERVPGVARRLRAATSLRLPQPSLLRLEALASVTRPLAKGCGGRCNGGYLLPFDCNAVTRPRLPRSRQPQTLQGTCMNIKDCPSEL